MTDAFALFGLPRRYQLNLTDLRKTYLAQSRALHPDRHSTSMPANQDEALRRTSELNRAYQTLTQPAARLEHLLQLEGLIAPDGSTHLKLDSEFLLEVMELGEQVHDPLPSTRDALAQTLAQRIDHLQQLIDTAMRSFDASADGSVEARQALTAALEALLRQRSLRRVNEQIG